MAVKTGMKNLQVLVALVTAFGAVAGCTGPRQEMATQLLPGQKPHLKWEANGIEVVRIRPALDGLMLDLRYRITDEAKAVATLQRNTPLSLIDQATGQVLQVPNMAKVGKMRNVPNKDDEGKILWIFFGNPDGAVKTGSKVTFVIGDVQIKDITVE
jgi:hypothetical protein